MEIRVGQTWNVVSVGTGINPDQNPITITSEGGVPGRYEAKTSQGLEVVLIQQWVDDGLLTLVSDAVEPEPPLELDPEPPLELDPGSLYYCIRPNNNYSIGRVLTVYKHQGRWRNDKVLHFDINQRAGSSHWVIEEDYRSGNIIKLEPWQVENLRKGRNYAWVYDPMPWLENLQSQLGVMLPPDLVTKVNDCKNDDEVNAVYFPYVQQVQASNKLTDEERRKLREIHTIDNSREYKYLEELLDNSKRELNRLYERIDSAVQDIHDRKRNLRNMVVHSEYDVSIEVDKILEGGFYSLARNKTYTCPNKLLWFTTKDITLTHKNPSAGIDLEVPMGNYYVTVNMETYDVRVKPCNNNLQYSGYYHPHVNESGRVCWGNAAEVMAQALEDMKPSVALTALQIILTTYNDESPYALLRDFEESYEMNGEDPTKDEDYYEEEE